MSFKDWGNHSWTAVFIDAHYEIDAFGSRTEYVK